MENRQTKALQNALARGLYASGSIKGVSPVDLALLAILEDGNCHASHILGKLLKDWELNQIKVRIEKEMAGTASKSKKEPEAMELPEDLLS